MSKHSFVTGKDDTQDPALGMIRSKIDNLYKNEPSAKKELEEAKSTPVRSAHQQYMYDLSRSGKSLAQIQTDWHNYYVNLPDTQKHQVWQEFYAQHDNQNNAERSNDAHKNNPTDNIFNNNQVVASYNSRAGKKKPKTIAGIKNQLSKNPSTRSGKRKLSKKQHLKSILFGLSFGGLTMILMMFGFFNERFIAPFITPSKAVSSTPIIIDPSTTAVGPEPKIIIPKINLEVPVVYDLGSIEEDPIQEALENGVVHYDTTPQPGQEGNVAIVGHSSNNILNRGKYKFAFVLLKQLEVGDTFMLHKDGKRYVYKIYEKKIVKPTDIGVLGPAERPSTATLITCDPPGTSVNRLVVVGEQISPSPDNNGESTAKVIDSEPQLVPGNSPSLWSRLMNYLSD
jgi:sortase A